MGLSKTAINLIVDHINEMRAGFKIEIKCLLDGTWEVTSGSLKGEHEVVGKGPTFEEAFNEYQG